MIHTDSVKTWEAETKYFHEVIRGLHAENERLRAALDNRSRSDSILQAIAFTLNSAGVRDYEENPITEINVLQGVRRLVEARKG